MKELDEDHHRMDIIICNYLLKVVFLVFWSEVDKYKREFKCLEKEIEHLHDKYLPVIEMLKETLQRIEEKRGMTMLSECCVQRNCLPVYDDGEKISNCAYQHGVAHGYGECSSESSQALKEVEEMLK